MLRPLLRASVVVTVSLAELACSGTSAPPPPKPQANASAGASTPKPDTKPDTEPDTKPDTEPDTKPDTKLDTKAGGDNPAQTTPTADGGNGSLEKVGEAGGEAAGTDPMLAGGTKVERREDGFCYEVVYCAPNEKCNPPPPKKVRCPAPDSELFPAAKNPDNVKRRANGKCFESFPVKCPKGTRCNPPAPRQVRCPTEAPLPEATVVANVSQRNDGTCYEYAPVDCPKGVACNPPPPKQVQCPPAFAKKANAKPKAKK